MVERRNDVVSGYEERERRKRANCDVGVKNSSWGDKRRGRGLGAAFVLWKRVVESNGRARRIGNRLLHLLG